MKQLILLKNLQIRFKILINIIFFIIFFLFLINSNAISEIIIKGNKNISEETIKSFLPKNFKIDDQEILNLFQKKLFETGFFKSVKISIINNNLNLIVIENPKINFFYIEGIQSSTMLEKIEKNILAKENTIFSEYIIKKDINFISDFLNKIGYLNNSVNFIIKKIDHDKINLFYNISLNEKFKINRIFFLGDKKFKSSTLSDEIHSSEYGWWKFLSNSVVPSEKVIDYDLNKLKEFYLSNGYYDVQISSRNIEKINTNRANIIYSINAGNIYKINKINIIDNDNILDSTTKKEIEKIINKIDKNIFNKKLINKYYNLIENFITSKNINMNLILDIAKRENYGLDINFIIKNILNQKYVKKININGNNLTDEFVIRNNLFLNEGDLFIVNNVKKSVSKLEGSGLFTGVKYEIKEDIDNQVILNISVTEEPTGEISAGAGFGTTGAVISGTLNEKNFLGKGINFNTSINLGTENIFGNIKYTDSDFKNSGNLITYKISVENNYYENTGYENKLMELSTSTRYQIYQDIFFNPGVSIDFDRVTANSNASNLVKKREGDFLTSKLFYSLDKDTRNKQFNATEGYTFGAGQGLSFLFSDIPYISNSIFGSYYHEYSKNFIGSFKAQIRSINALDNDIKFSDRLFISQNNLRGFANRGTGPILDGDFIGGNYSYYSNFSSTFPNGLPDKWNAITNVFFDTANVWGVDYTDTIPDNNKIRSSVGVGFSWISPLGPISFTYAEPISKSKTDKVEQFSFKIGSAF